MTETVRGGWLTPAQVEMIEVYTGPAQMPAEFLDDSCAAIAIWTR